MKLQIRLGGVLVAHQAAALCVKVVLKAAGAVCPRTRKDQLGRALYRRWLENPNVVVNRADVFFERVSKPQLGWWR